MLTNTNYSLRSALLWLLLIVCVCVCVHTHTRARAHTHTHMLTYKNQMQPEVRLTLTAGDFVSLYSRLRPEEGRGGGGGKGGDGPAHRKFDCVVTCFFLDTGDDLIDYIQTIDALLDQVRFFTCLRLADSGWVLCLAESGWLLRFLLLDRLHCNL